MPGEFRVVECPACRLCRTDPWPDDPAAWYPDEYPQHGGGESVTARASRLALQRAGAGTGGAVMAFRGAGHEAWGVEPSPRAVETARARANHWVLNGSLDALLHEGGLPDGPWDLSRMSQVLEHVPDPLATLRSIRGLLAPGGRLVVGVPNIRSLAARATRGSWDGLEMPRHLVHYDRDSLRWVLALAGFRVSSLRTTPLMGVLPGSVDARTAGGDRQRGWDDALPVRLLAYPMEWGLGLIGQGDGLLAVARPTAARS